MLWLWVISRAIVEVEEEATLRSEAALEHPVAQGNIEVHSPWNMELQGHLTDALKTQIAKIRIKHGARNELTNISSETKVGPNTWECYSIALRIPPGRVVELFVCGLRVVSELIYKSINSFIHSFIHPFIHCLKNGFLSYLLNKAIQYLTKNNELSNYLLNG